MMFPAAANGHMPFVDRYREEQIRRIIAKAERQRRHSGPDRFESSPIAKVKDDRIRSMPALHGGSAAAAVERAKMRFLSTPEMSALPSDRRPHTARDASASALPSRSGVEKPQQSSFLAGLRKLFGVGGGKASKAAAAAAAAQSRDSTDASAAAGHRRPPSSSPIGIKKASAEAADGGAHKAKRQRTRTVSNISAVMETIVEQNETACSTEDVSDSSSSSPSSSSVSSSSSPYGCGSPATTTSSAPPVAASRGGLRLMESLRVNGYVYG